MKFHCIVVTITATKKPCVQPSWHLQSWQVSLSEKAEIVDVCRFPPLHGCQWKLTGPVENIKAERAFSYFFYIKTSIMQLSQSLQHLKEIGWDERGALCKLTVCCGSWFCSCSRSKSNTYSEHWETHQAAMGYWFQYTGPSGRASLLPLVAQATLGRLSPKAFLNWLDGKKQALSWAKQGWRHIVGLHTE